MNIKNLAQWFSALCLALIAIFVLGIWFNTQPSAIVRPPFGISATPTERIGIAGVTPIALNPGDSFRVTCNGVPCVPLTTTPGAFEIAAATYTPTATNTPTSTATRTNTPIPPTATPTNTSTPTPTSTPLAYFFPFVGSTLPATIPPELTRLPTLAVRVTNASGARVNGALVKIEQCSTAGAATCAAYDGAVTGYTANVFGEDGLLTNWLNLDYRYRVTVGAATQEFYASSAQYNVNLGFVQ